MVMEAAGAVGGAIGGALDMLKGTKAKLVVYGDNTPAGDQEIECMFNPSAYKLQQSVNIPRQPTPSRDGGTPEFRGTSAMTLAMELFFDDFGSIAGDVTPRISTLLSWTRPTQSSRDKGAPKPPRVKFVWGGNPELAGFNGFIKSVGVNYTVFRKDGTPVRAKVDLSIEGDPEDLDFQNPTSHAANSRRVHTVIEGDTLHSIAQRELGKPRHWRAIAELNGIDDPMRLTAGQSLLIPSAADAARGS